MKKLARLSLPALAILSLSSCALPPREAWRVIRQDGLFPYVAVELGNRPVPKYVTLQAVARSRFVTLTPSPKASGPAARAGDLYVMRPPCFLPSNRFLVQSVSVAPSPRIAVAPRRPAPSHPHPAVAVAPKRAAYPVVSAPVARPAPRPAVSAPVARPSAPPPGVAAAPVAKKPVMAVTPEVAAAPKARPAPPVVTEKPKTPPAPVPTKSESSTVVNAKPAQADLPFGTLIPGRPGLVNSPYAGKYQLVDVTGLVSGQEVKCPYSGKLFRVPGMQQATNSVKAATEPPPPPPQEKKP